VTDARRDLLWAAAAGGTAFAVYLRTLAPGLVAILDTPMFQFIGRVLGVAHNPGYPLYVLLTFPFSYLPIGSLAYRINLFSAVCGALTVGLGFLVARELGCRRLVCGAAVLGLAFGHIFWSQSVVAEVYTLDTAIIAGMLLALLVWGRTGRRGFFYASTGLFAAGLGNHTTIVGFMPGMAVYAWLTNRAFVARMRTLVPVALILCAGVFQYGFILLRSGQSGAYVESPAHSLAELVDVMSGRQFGDRLFAFGWQEVIRERLPWLVGRVVVPELTGPGLGLAIAGAVWLLWRRPSEGLLIGLGVLATAGFTVNYSVVDAPVFMIPATTMLWVLAAVGGERATLSVERVRMAGVLASAAMLTLPVWLFANNFAMTDRSRDTAAAVTFDRLFDALPDRTSLVREDFLVDRMVMFKLLGDRAAAGRRIELVGRDADALRARAVEGEHVFGFGRSVRRLRYEGLNFSYAPLPLSGDSLAVHLSRLAKGSVVAVAVPAAYAEAFRGHAPAALRAIGVDPDLSEPRKAALVAVGVVGARRGARVVADPGESRVGVSAGDAVGETGRMSPDAFEARAGLGEAAVRRGGRDIVWTRDGGAVAIWNRNGELAEAFAVQALDDFRVPVPSSALSVYRLEGIWGRQDLGAEWVSIAPVLRTGSLMLRVEGGRTVTAYLRAADVLAPRVFDQSSPDVAVEVGRVDDATRRALGTLAGVTEGGEGLLYRIEARATGQSGVSVLIALGGVPVSAVARVTPEGAAGENQVFSIDTSGLLRVRDRSSEVLLMARDEQSQLPGAGWSAVDWDAVSPFRWMTGVRAHVLLPTTRNGVTAVRVHAYGEDGRSPGSLRLLLNDTDLGAHPAAPGWAVYEWSVPEGAAVPGTNRATLVVDRLPPAEGGVTRGLAVSEIRLVSGGH